MRRALALQMAVVVREVFYAERHVGLLEKLFVLVAVRIEGADDEGAPPHHLAHPPRDVGLQRALGLTDRQLMARAEGWRPWRAYAAMHLWMVALGLAGGAAPTIESIADDLVA